MSLGTVALGIGLASCSAQTDDSTAPTEPPAPAPSAQSPVPTTAYIDGQYSATGWYGGLPSHHDVTLTIDGDMVTAVEITTPAEDETSLGYQQRFAEALPGAIIGHSIDEIAVDRLAGSSGCSEGFMNALAQIKDQAAA